MFPYTEKYTEFESDIQNNNLLYKIPPERISNLQVFLVGLSGPTGACHNQEGQDWEWGSYQSACEPRVANVVDVDMDSCCFALQEQDINERMTHGLRADAPVYTPFDGMSCNHDVDPKKSSVNRWEVLPRECTAAQSV